MSAVFGLVMTGGGSRGAYQAGVLKRVGELYRSKPSPFSVIAGASAGAINSVMIAAGVEDMSQSSRQLAYLWENLKAEQVFRTDIGGIGGGALQLLKDLSLGGVIGGGRAQGLLDASPLQDLLRRSIAFDRIGSAIEQGLLKALAITATDYGTGKAFIFVQGAEGHPLWKKSRRLTLPTIIGVDHIRASAAIPMVFSPIALTTEYGESYFGDGCLRLSNPLSPAIRLGADHIFAIGVRNQKAPDEGFDTFLGIEKDNHPKCPPMARVVGVIMNAIFLDHLDADVEHLQRMNELISNMTDAELARPMSEPMRALRCFSISPSVDLGQVALEHAGKMPTILRYLMKGLGSGDLESADLMSYLLFDADYTRDLIEIGYKDASARIEEIKEFLQAQPQCFS